MTAPPTRGVWAGIDVGTQGVRVTVLDEDGRRVASGRWRLRSHRHPPRRHEQRPEEWWEATVAACRQVAEAADLSALEALAICSTSGTVLLADAHGRPLTPAVMYDDDRGAPHVGAARAAAPDRWRALGVTIQASWGLPKALELLATTPGARAGGVRLMHCADFLASRLCGGATVATDTSHALKSGYDALAGAWPAGARAALDLPDDLLPDVVRPGTTLGAVPADVAAATGLPAGARVVAGMTDGCAAQIAANALRPGDGVSVLGTTLILKGVSDRPVHDPAGAVYAHAHPDGGWLPGGASNVGARALQAAFPGRELAELDGLAQSHEPAGGAIYPLVGPGERFPFYRPDAEPLEVGRFADEVDRYAALLQGVAFVERLGLVALGRLGARITGRLALTGGGTRSRYWTQLRADVLGREVELPVTPEPSVGMAVLAAAGDGSVSDAAARLLPAGTRIEPRPGAGARFEARYHELIDALAGRGYLDAELADAARRPVATAAELR
jgi:sugar (pentulose or hexulose) kinase